MHTLQALQPSANALDTAALTTRLAEILDLKEHSGDQRHTLEHFIRQCFASAHSARVTHFMPRLFSLGTKRGDLIAAFGLREAASSRLFLETYLERPIEQVLQGRLGQQVDRRDIIEVGNLSALYPGAARWLIVALTAMLHDESYKWVVFTGTAALRNGFARLGLKPIELASATREHLPEPERADWGQYYEHAPTVMAGSITYGYQSLLMQRNLSSVLRAGMESVEAA